MLHKSRMLLATFFGALLLALAVPQVALSADKKPLATKNPSVSVAASQVGYLQVGVGKWSRAKSYSYQWYLCTSKHSASKSKASDCTSISKATSKTFKVTTAQLDGYLMAGVTGKNSYGYRKVYSATTALTGLSYIKEPPTQTTAPSLSGQSATGSELSVNLGSFAGYPAPTTTFEGWYSCEVAQLTTTQSLPDKCTLITGAAQTYSIASNYSATYLLAKVKADNGIGSLTVYTPTSTQITDAPLAISNPSVPSTELSVGDQVTATAASFTGFPAPTVAGQWYRCESATEADSSLAPGCTIINLATASTYQTTVADLGYHLVFKSIATNSTGTAVSFSESTDVVENAPTYTGDVVAQISGLTNVSDTVSAVTGSWYGYPTVQFSYAWYACTDSHEAGAESVPEDCSDISNASSSTFTITRNELAKHLMVEISGINALGSTSYLTATVGAVQIAPTVVVAPYISGTAKYYEQLTASAGTWDADPAPEFTYEWYLCDSALASTANAKPSDCSAIGSATGSTYTPTQTDIGKYLVLAVTATNELGERTVYTASTQAVTSAPILLNSPSFDQTSSTTKPNATAKATPGQWLGYPEPNISYEWFDCDSECSKITDADSATFDASGITNGHNLKFKVTATNSQGSTSEFSTSESLVQEVPSITTNGSISGTPTAGQSLSLVSAQFAGYPTLTTTKEWFLCTSAPAINASVSQAGCTSVSTATSVSVLRSMQDKYLSVLQTASNVLGNVHLWLSSSVITAAPEASVAPSLSGTARSSSTLTAATGTWTGSATISYAYEWFKCTATVIASATKPDGCTTTSVTAATYALTTSDAQSYLSVKVTATNGAGSASMWSASTTIVKDAPANTVAPSISGSALVASSLSVSDGTWTGYPAPQLTYQWYSCTSSVASSSQSLAGGCTIINTNGTASSFDVTSTYANKYLLAAVTATNEISNKTVYTASSSIIKQAVALVSAPTISGTAQVGQTLTATTGSWSGTGTLTYSYLWYYCTASKTATATLPTGCTPTSTTTATYVPTSTQTQSYVVVRVTAANDVNSVDYWSASTTIVNQLPTNTSPPVISGGAYINGTLSVSTGTWSGYPAMSPSYTWYTCTLIHLSTSVSKPGDCTLASGTASTYSVPSTALNKYIVAAVKQTNAIGNSTVFTASTALIDKTGVTNTTPPTVSGPSAIQLWVGDTLTSADGTWAGTTPIDFTYRWFRCLDPQAASSTSLWSGCELIPLAATSTYTATDADAGLYISVGVKATNSVSNLEVFSATSLQVWQPIAPVVNPSATGTFASGSDVTPAEGTWEGYPNLTTNFTYEICGNLYVDSHFADNFDDCRETTISAGKVSLSAADVGKYLRVRVDATLEDSNQLTLQNYTNGFDLGRITGSPAFAFAPAIQGSQAVGQTVTLGAEQIATDIALTAHTYQWFSCATQLATAALVTAQCTDVTGVSPSSSHVISAGEAGQVTYAVITATNAHGTTKGLSQPVFVSAASSSDVSAATLVATYTTTPTCTGSPSYACALNLGDARFSKVVFTTIGAVSSLSGYVLFDQTLDRLTYSVTNNTASSKQISLNRKLTIFDGCGGNVAGQSITVEAGATKEFNLQLSAIGKFDQTHTNSSCTSVTGSNSLLWAWMTPNGDTATNAAIAYDWPTGFYGNPCVMNVISSQYSTCDHSTTRDPVTGTTIAVSTHVGWDANTKTLSYSVTNNTASNAYVRLRYNQVGICRTYLGFSVSKAEVTVRAGKTATGSAILSATYSQFDYASDPFVAAARADCSITSPTVTNEYGPSLWATVSVASATGY